MCGVLPLFLTRIPILGAKLTSLPYDAGSGGPLAADTASVVALANAAACRAHQLAVDHIEIRCDGPLSGLEDLPFARREPLIISEVAIGSGEDVLARVSTDQRRSVGKALRRGVSVRAAERLADMRRFYEVYCRVFRTMGTPPYGWRYFDLVWQRLGTTGEAVLHLAELNGDCVGGALLFCWGRRVISKFTLCLPEVEGFRVSAALYAETIRHACALGASSLSWGTSAPSQTGLIAFKERWAAVTRPVVIYGQAVRSPLPSIEHLYDSDTVVRRAWRHLPLSLTKIGGAMLNRWYC